MLDYVRRCLAVVPFEVSERHRRHRALEILSPIALVILFASGCASQTSLRLTVLYEDAWALDELDVAAGGRSARVGAAHEVLVLVSDEAAGEDLTIEVSGLRDGTRAAFGRVVVRPVLGSEVRATVALARLACGAWCSEGATACEGDGVVACERDEDGCMRWGAPAACPSATPFCSLGVCGAECFDECAGGEQRCAGPEGVQQCGQADSDPCRDWLTLTACAEGEQCESGRCASECTGECEDGAVQCRDGGLSYCADRDFDGCPEWGPSEPCESGESCEGSACLPIQACADQCAGSACTGTTLTHCGNYDFDPCLEPSPGTSCVPADLCLEGRCTLSGCESSARVCTAPPASFCVDSSTLRVYESAGTCTSGACDYPFRDQACPSCPTCEACAGVSCDTPPDPTCVDATTLRTFTSSGTCSDGTCSYASIDSICEDSCLAGHCVTCPIPWTLERVDAAGSTVVSGANTSFAHDASGGIHIAYWDATNNRLRYAYRSPSGPWTTSTVVSGGIHPSIAVDASGGVHISYQDRVENGLRYAYDGGGGPWVSSTIDSDVSTGYDTALALDDEGGIHIVYTSHYDWSSGDLRYAYRSATGSWTTRTIVAEKAAGTAITIDRFDRIHVSYFGYSGHSVRYAYRSAGGSWATSTIASAANSVEATGIAVDWSGGVHVSYYGTGLSYAYGPPGGFWSSTAVDTVGSVGRFNSLAIDPSGGIHISYEDGTNNDLRYAYRAVGGSWTTTTLEAEGDTGSYTSIETDGDGGVHISYRSESTGDIRYAYRRVCL